MALPLVGPSWWLVLVVSRGGGAAVTAVLGRDPGGEQAVGMVREVVADQGVEQLRVVVEVGRGEGDELPVPGDDGTAPRPGEVRPRFVGHESGCYQEPGGVVPLRAIEDLCRRRVVAADQSPEKD